MDIRYLTPDFAVSPQITPQDVAVLKAEGFATIICNRPDMEVPPPVQAEAVRKAAEDAGLAFVLNPVVNGALHPDNVTLQAEAISAAAGPVFAYCGSGTRSSIVWSLAQAGRIPTDEIIAATGRAGYALEGMRAQIDALARG